MDWSPHPRGREPERRRGAAPGGLGGKGAVPGPSADGGGAGSATAAATGRSEPWPSRARAVSRSRGPRRRRSSEAVELAELAELAPGSCHMASALSPGVSGKPTTCARRCHKSSPANVLGAPPSMESVSVVSSPTDAPISARWAGTSLLNHAQSTSRKSGRVGPYNFRVNSKSLEFAESKRESSELSLCTAMRSMALMRLQAPGCGKVSRRG